MTGESVEQAALRRTEDRIDWKPRAEREAAAFLDEIAGVYVPSRDLLITWLAVMWLQGVNFGSHHTLSAVEASFEEARAAL